MAEPVEFIAPHLMGLSWCCWGSIKGDRRTVKLQTKSSFDPGKKGPTLAREVDAEKAEKGRKLSSADEGNSGPTIKRSQSKNTLRHYRVLKRGSRWQGDSWLKRRFTSHQLSDVRIRSRVSESDASKRTSAAAGTNQYEAGADDDGVGGPCVKSGTG